jgi:HNH endonuclease
LIGNRCDILLIRREVMNTAQVGHRVGEHPLKARLQTFVCECTNCFMADEICPYSESPSGEFSDDHIFPEFLGGHRSIRICRDCNSLFGHSFEARAASQLKRMQVFISHFGLDLTRACATWPSALVIDGTAYDLKSGPLGVQYELARPVILRNEAGT